jgi:hypothetical protein
LYWLTVGVVARNGAAVEPEEEIVMIVNDYNSGLFFPVIAYGSSAGGGSGSTNTTTINKTPGQTVNRADKTDLNPPRFSWKDHGIPDKVELTVNDKGFGGGVSFDCGSCHGSKK